MLTPVEAERSRLRTLLDTYVAGLSGRNADAAKEMRVGVEHVFALPVQKTDERSEKSYATNDDDCG